MEQFVVTGMSCAACQARVEKAVSKVPGVTSCSVSLLTNSMGVEGTADEKAIIQAVEHAGYGAALKGEETAAKKSASSRLAAEEDALKDRETPKLKKRLKYSVIFLVLLMYITMGHNMWNWPLPSFLVHNHLGLALTQMLLALVVMGVFAMNMRGVEGGLSHAVFSLLAVAGFFLVWNPVFRNSVTGKL